MAVVGHGILPLLRVCVCTATEGGTMHKLTNMGFLQLLSVIATTKPSFLEWEPILP